MGPKGDCFELKTMLKMCCFAIMLETNGNFPTNMNNFVCFKSITAIPRAYCFPSFFAFICEQIKDRNHFAATFVSCEGWPLANMKDSITGCCSLIQSQVPKAFIVWPDRNLIYLTVVSMSNSPLQ